MTINNKIKRIIPSPLYVLLRKAYYFLRRRIDRKLSELVFFANYKKRRRLYSTYKLCVTPEDYFAFCDKISAFLCQQKNEIFGLLEYANKYQPKCVIEIGTSQCGVTFLLSHILESVSLVIGIDLFVTNGFLLHYFSRSKQRIKFIDGSSYAASTVKKVKNTLVGKKVDILFIDGDHSYDGVKKDFLNYRQFVAENGIIAFHDILLDYSTRYSQKTFNYAGGVPDFYNKIKQLYPSVEFVDDPGSDGFGIGLIRYSSHVILPSTL